MNEHQSQTREYGFLSILNEPLVGSYWGMVGRGSVVIVVVFLFGLLV